MPRPEKYDFCGWATRYNIQCADGLTIHNDAFKDNDGMTVPMVWNHDHNNPSNVLGHSYLENRPEGVYSYNTFNDTDAGNDARILVNHGDIVSLSICANRLKKNVNNVMHGMIREVSLVLAGANPGAYIESVIAHDDDSGECAIVYSGEDIELFHADEKKEIKDMPEKEEKKPAEEAKEPENEKKERTVKDVFDEFTEEQKDVVYALIAAVVEKENGGDEDEPVKDVFDEFTEEQKNVVYALIAAAVEKENGGDEDEPEETEDEEEKPVKHNVFDKETEKDDTEVLTHSEMVQIFDDFKRNGSLRDTVLQHGITNIGNLFPEVQAINNVPETVSRRMEWVNQVMNRVHKSPFSRVKSWYIDITGEEARARGYVKGNQKVEEVIAALKRWTPPTTVYKLQKLDRDDVIDITDFDIVAWIKKEMRTMLDEELARAILIGDGRSVSSNDKINEGCIRPIWTDDDVYTIKYILNSTTPKAFIQGAVRSRKYYEGAGNPILFTTEDMLTECLLMEDLNQRIIYETVDKLKTALRVSDIVTVPILENQTRDVSGTTRTLLGIIVNPVDYNVGADRGGQVSLFDDFDINYNKQEYLIETRCSGALVKPHSAIALEYIPSSNSESIPNPT